MQYKSYIRAVGTAKVWLPTQYLLKQPLKFKFKDIKYEIYNKPMIAQIAMVNYTVNINFVELS